MDEKNLLKYIKSYLIKGNSFVLTGVGEFSTTYKPAEIDESRKKMTPPGQDIHFDPGKTQDDEKLAVYVAQKAGMSKQEAAEQIRGFASTVADKLESEGNYYISGLGNLSKEGDTISFKQDDKEILASDTYGMSTVRFVDEAGSRQRQGAQQQTAKSGQKQTGTSSQQQPAKQPQTASASNSTTKGKYKAPTPQTQNTNPMKINSARAWVMPLIVGLIVLVVVLAGGYTLIRTGVIGSAGQDADNWIAKVRDFRVFGSDDQEKEKGDQKKNDKSTEQKQPKTSDTTKQQKAKQEGTGEDKEQQEKSQEAYKEPERQSSSEDRFYLIAGSYKKFDNAYEEAEAYVEEGFDAEVLKSDKGMFRVAIASYNYRSKAVQEMNRLKENENIKSWVLQK